MMVVMRTDATREQIAAAMDKIRQHDLVAQEMPGGERVAIGIPSSIPPALREPLAQELQALLGVDHVVHITRSYKLASREFHAASTVVTVSGVAIGGNQVVVIAGPCAVETREQTLETARAVKAAGATVLRGGAYKPRTSPYSFQGLKEEGLRILREVGAEVGLPTVSEVVDPHDVGTVAAHADILQIGARNMQNYPLLIAAGESGHPVLLKRGPSATMDELLLAAEYLLSRGNSKVMLCERGIQPLDREYTRYTLDILSVPVLKEITHLPIIVDPSHAAGDWRWVGPAARAAVAAGADGLIIEVHPHPDQALCDGPQQIRTDRFAALMESVRRVAAATGRPL